MKTLLWLTDNISSSQSLISEISYTSHVNRVIDISQESHFHSQIYSEYSSLIIHITGRKINNFFHENISTLLEEKSTTVHCVIITPIGNCFLPVKDSITELIQTCYTYDNTKVIGYSYILKSGRYNDISDTFLNKNNTFFQPIEPQTLSHIIDISLNQQCDDILIFAVSKDAHNPIQKHNFFSKLFKKKSPSSLDIFTTPKLIESTLSEQRINTMSNKNKNSIPQSTEVQ